MIDYDKLKLKAWASVLKDIAREYGNNRSIGNVIDNIEARIKNEGRRQQ